MRYMLDTNICIYAIKHKLEQLWIIKIRKGYKNCDYNFLYPFFINTNHS